MSLGDPLHLRNQHVGVLRLSPSYRFKSIPAFTANLTMELFQKQTQC